jgi:hypothetical protein
VGLWGAYYGCIDEEKLEQIIHINNEVHKDEIDLPIILDYFYVDLRFLRIAGQIIKEI